MTAYIVERTGRLLAPLCWAMSACAPQSRTLTPGETTRRTHCPSTPTGVSTRAIPKVCSGRTRLRRPPEGRACSADGKIADAKPEETAQLCEQIGKGAKSHGFCQAATRLSQTQPDGSRVPQVIPGSGAAVPQQAELPTTAPGSTSTCRTTARSPPFLVDIRTAAYGAAPSWGIGWYRKKLKPAGRQRRALDLSRRRRRWMSYSEVWLNGHPSAAGRTATTSWRLDLTPYVSPGGVNQLAIRLDNPPESSRWYPGGGLYRNVRLTKTNRAPLHAVAGHARDGTGRRRRRGDPA